MIIAIVAGFALAFALLGGLSIGFSAPALALLSVAGALFGAIAAPEIEPRAFRRPVLWQIGFAVAGCLLVAALLGADAEGYGLAVALGLILGFFAPSWIKHLTLP
ncbi:hypothetical protein JL37_09705 [Achromobacter sp. RTa]|nr:hypothetical protein JL37_09705 [Achromobacter sp. RTa]